MLEQYFLEQEISDSGGEITEEQDLIWQSKDIEIKDKLDSYGHLFDELTAEKKKLAEIKANGVTRVSEATRRIEKLERELKSRLNFLSHGETLRGHLYSFHPYESRKHTVDLERLEPSDTYLTIEIREDYFNQLIDHYTADGAKLLPADMYVIKKRAGKVSELPKDHPAVVTVQTPSVRIT